MGRDPDSKGSGAVGAQEAEAREERVKGRGGTSAQLEGSEQGPALGRALSPLFCKGSHLPRSSAVTLTWGCSDNRNSCSFSSRVYLFTATLLPERVPVGPVSSLSQNSLDFASLPRLRLVPWRMAQACAYTAGSRS